MFHRIFAEKITDWKIVGDTPVLHAGKQEFIIPDISFESQQKDIIHLELFHRWHKTQLEQRLKTLVQRELPLILGVDRSIMPNEEFETLLQENPALENRIFRFSDFPGVETVHRILKRKIKTL
jgi:predicted nuclease of restriction endonuclease-like RecB superfamily